MNRVFARNLLYIEVIFFIVGFASVRSLKCYSNYHPSNFGDCKEARDCTGATLRYNCTGGPNIVCCVFDSGSMANFDLPNSDKTIVTQELFYQMVGNTLRTQSIYPFYEEALRDANITTNVEIAAFTAQILFTTENMTISEEDTDGLEYEGDASLGNTRAGDGAKFRRRGFLPLIGRSMYKRVNDAIRVGNLISNPEKAAMPSTGFEIASWLWKNGYGNGYLGEYCDGTTYNFLRLSFEIHQKTEKVEKQLGYWWTILKMLGLPCPKMGSGPSCTLAGEEGTCMVQRSCKSRHGNSSCSPSTLIKCCLNCQNPIDLAFVVDSSSSVGSDNFKKGLEFIAALCNISSDETRVALIRFATKASVIFNFNNHTNKTDLLDSIQAVNYTRGGTRTDLGLSLAHEELFRTEKSGVRPKARGIPRVLVLLTDGRANRGTESVRRQSEVLRDDGVNIFAVGIGPKINLQELNAIASDPDEHHVMLSDSFEDVSKMVQMIQERYCYEPALIEPEITVSSTVDQHFLNYYKYELQDASGIETIRLKTLKGQVKLVVSLQDENPRQSDLLTDSCEDLDKNYTARNRNVHSFSSNIQFENIKNQSARFCRENPSGAVTSALVLPDETVVVYAIVCSSRWVYVAVEGLSITNEFNLTLTQRIPEDVDQTNFTQDANSSHTFAIRQEVYVSAGIAMTATAATVATYVTLSCAGKSFEIQSSSKVKKKKKKKKEKEEDEEAKICGSQKDTSEPNNNDTNYNGKGSLTSRKSTLSTSVTIVQANKTIEHETTAQGRRKKSVIFSYMKADMKTVKTIEEGDNPSTRHETRVAMKIQADQREGTEVDKDISCEKQSVPKLPHRRSLISSMIGALRRKDSHPPTVQSYDNDAATLDEEAGITRAKGARSGSVSIEVNELNLSKGEKGETQRKNTKEKRKENTNKAVGIGNVPGDSFVSNSDSKRHATSLPKATTSKQQQRHPVQNTKRKVEQRELLSNDSSSSIQPSSEATKQTGISCCVVCLPKKSSARKTQPSKQGSEANEAIHTDGQTSTKKKSLRERLRSTFTKRNIFACFCPCFTYYILDECKAENDNVEEYQEKRDKRLERDMKISQASCIMLSQAVFFLGAENTENKIQCAAVAISMNYFYLVALGWLIAQALYIFSFTKTNQSAKSRSKMIKFYYISAWGLPLIVVFIMMGNTAAFSDNAHCWTSFMDSVSWAVSTPLATMSLVQVIIVVLLIKALVTFKKTKDQEEDAIRMGIIRSGLITVVCLFLTILLTWLLGTVSLNIDKKVYSDFFAVFNALQGVLLFVFFVVLSPEVRLLLMTIWGVITQLKESAVTPFDEYEGLEIEEDKDKDKKKKRNVMRAMETGTNLAMASSMLSSARSTKNPRNQENQKDTLPKKDAGLSRVKERVQLETQTPHKGDTTARKKSVSLKQRKDSHSTLPRKTSQSNKDGGKTPRGTVHKANSAVNTDHQSSSHGKNTFNKGKTARGDSSKKILPPARELPNTLSVLDSRVKKGRNLEPISSTTPKSPNLRQ